MPRVLTLLAVLFCCGALGVLALRPQLDLDVATLFYVGGGHFVGDTPAGRALRYTAWSAPFLLYGLMWLAWICRHVGLVPPRRAPSFRSLAFVTLALVVAPGLLVHVTLKERSHRPRPYAVAAFEGRDEFRPFDRFDGACRHDCSFPSGEAAVTAWTLAPASLAPPPWRGLAVVAALAFAAVTGLWRMALGAHFLSDICAGILITILVVGGLRVAVMTRPRRDPDT